MTREEFVKAWAKDKNLEVSDGEAALGFIRVRKTDGTTDYVTIALPCACGSKLCEGWGMISELLQIDHHFLFDAPEELRNVYAKYVR